MDKPKRIGFISTRIAGNDGVSLEIEKWASVLSDLGHKCFYIAGLLDRSPIDSYKIPEAFFYHPTIDNINRKCFGTEQRSPVVSEQIHEMTLLIKEKIYTAHHAFNLDIIIAENCLTIPMNIPLGLAIVEYVMETGIPCIAHHHDFVWERERFLVNAVDDYLKSAFPPPLLQMKHVVINSHAAEEFSRRTGLPCAIIPNVMDFHHAPPPPDDYAKDFRSVLGLSEDDIIILQPTRVVHRKGIETTVELVKKLNDPRCKVVITHGGGDEGALYVERVHEYAKLLGVEVIFADQWITNIRATRKGKKTFTVWDAYHHADLVTYPSTYEGFGNAFLEAVYYKKPILCNRYGIFKVDIEPCGFDVVVMDGFLTNEVVEQVRSVLNNKDLARQMVEKNYEIGKRLFSYNRVKTSLKALLVKPSLRLNHTLD